MEKVVIWGPHYINGPFFLKRKMPVFDLIFSQSLAFLVPFGHCFRCFEVVGGGGGVVITLTPQKCRGKQIYC